MSVADRRLRNAALIAALAIAGCAPTSRSSAEIVVEDRGVVPASSPTPLVEPTPAPADPATRLELIGSALPTFAAAAMPVPVRLDIGALGVDGAVIRSVGVEADGALEVPPADEVGWYRYGPTPGADGSAVLAAHIAADGVDGVFRRLPELEPGDIVTVHFDDATSEEFVVVGRRQYAKEALPGDEIFGRTGVARLTLVTCGGTFDPERRRYDDNIVVFALPV